MHLQIHVGCKKWNYRANFQIGKSLIVRGQGIAPKNNIRVQMRAQNVVIAILLAGPLRGRATKLSRHCVCPCSQPSQAASWAVQVETLLSQALASTIILLLILSLPTLCLASEELDDDLPDLTSLTLEALTSTDVLNATSFVQQAVDAPSAVSVVTAEEIRRFGYRTISEILDSMRGIHITYDKQYAFLGGRGYGAPREYAGRIILLIDGYSAADNYYNQIFISDDGYLDTALIDRIEYAPGPGSAIYGNNAFLGVVNIITKKGRNVDGMEAEITRGSHKDREGRFTWGKRAKNGVEWLVSASGRGKNGLYSQGQDTDYSSSEREFVKLNYKNWSFELLASDKQTENHDWDFFGDPLVSQMRDRNRSLNIAYDSDLNKNWKTNTKFYYADYLYDLQEDYVDEEIFTKTNGAWYGIDSKAMYLGFERHQLLFGAEYHVDSRQDYKIRFSDWGLSTEWYITRNDGDILSVYGDDAITITSLWSASIGGRYDRRRYKSLDQTQGFFSPRVALFYNPDAELSLRLSYGQANRFNSIFDIDPIFSDEVSDPQRVRTAELVIERRKRGVRTLASLYRYRVDRLSDDLDVEYQDIKGVELESHWLWSSGTTLRGSYAWQSANDNEGLELPNIPHSIAKLQLSIPILSERLRASLAVRYLGKRKNLYQDEVDAHTITDLTLTATDIYPGTALTLAFRNLFNTQYGDVAYVYDESGLLERDGRTLWLSLLYSPR